MSNGHVFQMTNDHLELRKRFPYQDGEYLSLANRALYCATPTNIVTDWRSDTPDRLQLTIQASIYDAVIPWRAKYEDSQAELAQEREDARVLAAWVRTALLRNRGERNPGCDDIRGALERNKP